MARAPREPRPDLAEAERLVWEYLLLVPGVEDEGHPSFDDGLKALGRIGNDACVPVLGEVFGKDREYMPNAQYTGPQTVLEALEEIPSARSLDAILDCAAAAERAQLRLEGRIAHIDSSQGRWDARHMRWHPMPEAERIGGPDGDPDWLQRWAVVIGPYRLVGHDPLKVQMLYAIRKRLREGRSTP